LNRLNKFLFLNINTFGFWIAPIPHARRTHAKPHRLGQTTPRRTRSGLAPCRATPLGPAAAPNRAQSPGATALCCTWGALPLRRSAPDASSHHAPSPLRVRSRSWSVWSSGLGAAGSWESKRGRMRGTSVFFPFLFIFFNFKTRFKLTDVKIGAAGWFNLKNEVQSCKVSKRGPFLILGSKRGPLMQFLLSTIQSKVLGATRNCVRNNQKEESVCEL
jgi:hypothetical protein